MSDIFISYASADRVRAAQLSDAMQARGWSIWWDRTIPPGRQYDEVIEEALSAARCVVVLWSHTSTASNWVKNEAADAMGRKALIPAIIDADVKIPLEFRRLQAADLTQWRGESSTPAFNQLCDAIAGVLNQPVPSPPPQPPPQPPPPPPPRPASTPSNSKRTWIGVAIAVGVVAGIAMFGNRTPEPPPSPIPPPTPIMPSVAPQAGYLSPISMNLQWRDYVLVFAGHLSWDGRSPNAEITASIKDANTGQSLANNQRVNAVVSQVGAPGQGRYMFSTQVRVPYDSQTAGRHIHNVNLILQTYPAGGWQYIQNCMTPNQCY